MRVKSWPEFMFGFVVSMGSAIYLFVESLKAWLDNAPGLITTNPLVFGILMAEVVIGVSIMRNAVEEKE